MPASLTRNQYKDSDLNRFSKTNLYYTSEKYLLYQDPTWLGFKLFFSFNNDDSRLMYGVPDTNSNSTSDPLRPESLKPNTAYAYLTNIGESTRADYLSKFVNHLKQINQITPWFFQTIEGLGEAWRRGFNEDSFRSEIPKDRKITIGCLESIDLRISALIDLYRKSCFDWKYRREIVPWNLRTFTVWIYVYELRNINRSGMPSPSGLLDLTRLAKIPDINERHQKLNDDLLGADPSSNDKNSSKAERVASQIRDDAAGNNLGLETINGIRNSISPEISGSTPNEKINRFLFKFSHCEWLPDESGDFLSRFNNSIESGNMVQQKLVFSYRNVEEENLYNIYAPGKLINDSIIRILDSAAKDIPIAVASKTMNSIENEKYNALLPFASLAGDKAERLLNSFAGKLLMGNVYGFSPTNTIGDAEQALNGDPTAVVRGTESLVNSVRGSNSLRNANRDSRNLGNIFE